MGDLLISYDEGVSSIGWAVWKTSNTEPELLGTGDVDFPTDDCLASKRRQLCHLRRTIRSRRQCIEQLGKFFIHLGLLKPGETNTNQASGRDYRTHPWFLAGRLLAAPESESSKFSLTPQELWSVLRWYAHNRGYYVPWAKHHDESDEDTRKEAAARAMMERFGKTTMAETFCAQVGITDPLNPPAVFSGAFVGTEFKGKHNGKSVKEVPAFPREDVLIPEVKRILQAHRGRFASFPAFADYPFDKFVSAIIHRWEDIPRASRLFSEEKNAPDLSEEQQTRNKTWKIWLPNRYEGGLLFGQRIPRFDNRIISCCPVKPGVKTPLKQCREFYEYRWAMLVANIKAGPASEDYKPLRLEQRRLLDAEISARGFLGPRELHQVVKKITGQPSSNIRKMFTDTPELKKSLVVEPVDRYLANEKEIGHWIWPVLPVKLQRNLRNALWRGKRFKVKALLEMVASDNEAKERFDAAIDEFIKSGSEKPGGGDDETDAEENVLELFPAETGEEDESGATAPKIGKRGRRKLLTRSEILACTINVPVLTGRAPYCRAVLRQAASEVFTLGCDPRRYSADQLKQESVTARSRIDRAEEKPKHGCLAGVEEVNARTLGILATEEEREADYQKWRAGWITKKNSKGEDLNRRRAEKYGEPWVRRQYETPALEKWLSAKTNNHLVRQRMLILDRLTQDIIEEFAGGNPKLVGRIAVEVARDLVTFSGMSSKERGGDDKGIMGSIRAQHVRVTKWLKKNLPLSKHHLITGRVIWAAKVAEDLDYRDPYRATHPVLDPLILARAEYQTDHIIPKSVRLTNAMEAVVMTTPEINHRKGPMTSLQFIMEMNKRENIAERDHLGICSVKSYLDFVEGLKTFQPRGGGNGSDEEAGDDGDGKTSSKINPKYLPGTQRLHPDFKRRKRRKEFLLVPEYNKENDSFTSRQLTQTSHLNRLAQAVLLRRFPDLREEDVVSIPGQVTKALRDSGGWNLFSCLGHRDVCGDAATHEVARYDKSTKEALVSDDGQTVMKRVARPKEELRKLTHLHHAVDACGLGLIAHWLPKNGKLWELLALGELTEKEKDAYESLQYQFARGELDGGRKVMPRRLDDFLTCYRIDESKARRSPDPARIYRLEPKRTPEAKARMCRIRDQISTQLAKKRVIQHIPAEHHGMPTDETIYRVIPDLNGKEKIVEDVKARIASQRETVLKLESAFRHNETKLRAFDEAIKAITDKAEQKAKKVERQTERKALAKGLSDARSARDKAQRKLDRMEDFQNSVWLIKYIRAESVEGKDIQKRFEKAAKAKVSADQVDSQAEGDPNSEEEGETKTKAPPELLGNFDIKRDKLFRRYEIVNRGKLIGLSPNKNARGRKLGAIKAAKELRDNFGVAVMDDATAGERKFVLIPQYKVWVRIHQDWQLDGRAISLVKLNGGTIPPIIRKGDIIEMEEEGRRMRYRIHGFGERPGRGIYFDYAVLDALKRCGKELTPEQLVAGEFQLLKTSLTGFRKDACPTTSSASTARSVP